MNAPTFKFANGRIAHEGDVVIGRTADGHIVAGMIDVTDMASGQLDGVALNTMYNAADAFATMEAKQAEKNAPPRTSRTISVGFCKAGCEG